MYQSNSNVEIITLQPHSVTILIVKKFKSVISGVTFFNMYLYLVKKILMHQRSGSFGRKKLDYHLTLFGFVCLELEYQLQLIIESNRTIIESYYYLYSLAPTSEREITNPFSCSPIEK